uniref:DNA polymerase epsilon subunit 3 n=1 Tax=Poecilia reticulata TaxID=8081 RepID=A0A3P9NVA1_POERE
MAERPEDLNLPNAVITRIIKEALPDGVNVSKEARRAISQAASVFVLYATSCANNFAMKAKRKTLNAGDVLAAMEEMEFERFLEPLRDALEGKDTSACVPTLPLCSESDGPTRMMLQSTEIQTNDSNTGNGSKMENKQQNDVLQATGGSLGLKRHLWKQKGKRCKLISQNGLGQ